MSKLDTISPEASLVLVVELITVLERQRDASDQPSLIADLRAAIAEAWKESNAADSNLRAAMADAQDVLTWVEGRLAPQDLHFGDLVAEAPKKTTR
jgi:hypothetical protein